MAKSTKTTATTKRTAKTVKVSVHLPGQLPQESTYKADATLADVIADFNLDGYDVSLNGSKSSNSTPLSKGDIIRVGVKTKNAF